MKAAFSVLRMTTPILDPTYLLVCKFADCIRYSISTRFEKNPFARNLEFAAYLTIATSICCLFTSWEPLALILRENMQQVSSGCNTCNRAERKCRMAALTDTCRHIDYVTDDDYDKNLQSRDEATSPPGQDKHWLGRLREVRPTTLLSYWPVENYAS